MQYPKVLRRRTSSPAVETRPVFTGLTDLLLPPSTPPYPVYISFLSGKWSGRNRSQGKVDRWRKHSLDPGQTPRSSIYPLHLTAALRGCSSQSSPPTSIYICHSIGSVPFREILILHPCSTERFPCIAIFRVQLSAPLVLGLIPLRQPNTTIQALTSSSSPWTWVLQIPCWIVRYQ